MMAKSWVDRVEKDMKYLACFGKAQCIGAVPARELHGWRHMSITVDSGAADSVADPECFPGYAVARHDRPIFYQRATGEPITNVGAQQVAFVSREGTLRGMTFQSTAKVRKPLASVKRIVESGHAVIFDPGSLGWVLHSAH